MNLTPTETSFLIYIITSVLVIFGGVIIWILNRGVGQMDKISRTLTKMEFELGMLAQDHRYLRDEVKEIKNKVKELEDI